MGHAFLTANEKVNKWEGPELSKLDRVRMKFIGRKLEKETAGHMIPQSIPNNHNKVTIIDVSLG